MTLPRTGLKVAASGNSFPKDRVGDELYFWYLVVAALVVDARSYSGDC